MLLISAFVTRFTAVYITFVNTVYSGSLSLRKTCATLVECNCIIYRCAQAVMAAELSIVYLLLLRDGPPLIVL